jgi:hypothetical protein
MQIKAAIPYLTIFALVSLLSGFVYTEEQQVWRMSANDPQIQMAEDIAAGVSKGTWPAVGTDAIDISTSLAPFFVVYDKDGRTLSSNASLDGRIPSLPPGIFAWVRSHGEDRVTWQPRPRVRIALVVAPVSGGAGGFVACGRSLREVEKRIEVASERTILAWAAMLAVGLGGLYLTRRRITN